MVAREATNVMRFRKCFDAHMLTILADRFVVGVIERECKDNLWDFGLGN